MFAHNWEDKHKDKKCYEMKIILTPKKNLSYKIINIYEIIWNCTQMIGYCLVPDPLFSGGKAP